MCKFSFTIGNKDNTIYLKSKFFNQKVMEVYYFFSENHMGIYLNNMLNINLVSFYKFPSQEVLEKLKF